jgi:hypothetical protein
VRHEKGHKHAIALILVVHVVNIEILDSKAATSCPGVAQVGNQNVPRPDKVSDRSVPDDIDE